MLYLKKASDWVLKKIPSKPSKVIEDMSIKTATPIQTGNELSEPTKYKSGIRQGDSLSSVLFKVMMDGIYFDMWTMQYL